MSDDEAARFLTEFKASGLRVDREINGWSAAASGWEESARQISAYLQPRLKEGKSAKRVATQEAIERSKPELTEFRAAMNSSSRQVRSAVAETQMIWDRHEHVWHEATRRDRETVAEVADSFRRLGIAVGGARRTNGALRQSLTGYLEFAPQEVFEAIDAIDNADECCIYLRDFVKIVVTTLAAALGER